MRVRDQSALSARQLERAKYEARRFRMPDGTEGTLIRHWRRFRRRWLMILPGCRHANCPICERDRKPPFDQDEWVVALEDWCQYGRPQTLDLDRLMKEARENDSRRDT